MRNETGELLKMLADASEDTECLPERLALARQALSGIIMDELTDRQRDMLMMRYFRQMRVKDIARELGVTPATVSKTIKRGRMRIRRCLRVCFVSRHK